MALRPERFGGLVYRYANRRLFFLHSHPLVALVSELDGTRPLAQTLDAFLSARDLPGSVREPLIKALARLQHLEIIDSP